MTVGAVLTLGFGQFGTVNLLPTLGYSSGAQQTNLMPRVINMNLWQAIATLIEADILPNIGLVPGTATPTVGYFQNWPCEVEWMRTNTVPPGWVVSQFPAAGTPNITFDTPVTLTVAQFPFGVADKFTAGGYS